MRFLAPVVTVGHAHANGGKAGTHPAASSFSPADLAQVGGTQTQGNVFRREWLMLFISSQQSGRTVHFALRLRRQWHDIRRPKHARGLNADSVRKPQRDHPFTKVVIVAISGICQHHTAWHILVHQRMDMAESNIRLRLKTNLLGNARLLASLLVVSPGLGKIEPIGRGNTVASDTLTARGSSLAYPTGRSTDERRQPNVFPSWGISCHRQSRQPEHVCASWMEEPGCELVSKAHHRSRSHRPRCGARLVHLTHVARSQTCCHRLDALALNRQHQALGVVRDGNHTISMPGSLGQTIQIGLQTFPLTGEIRNLAAHCLQPTAQQSQVPVQPKHRNLLCNISSIEDVCLLILEALTATFSSTLEFSFRMKRL